MESYTIIWLVMAVVLGAIEATTATLTTVWMAIAALIVAVIAEIGASVYAQLLVFVTVSAVLVLLTRPLARKFVSKKAVPTNADRIISTKGVVVKEISFNNNSGQIKVLGQIWSAKSEDGQVIPEGTEIMVTRLEGVRAVVERAEEMQTV